MSRLDNLKSRNACIYKLYRYTDIYINLRIEELYTSYPSCTDSDFRSEYWGQPRWLSGLALPATCGVILGTRDQVPRWAPCMEPASPSAWVSASLSLCLS